MCQFGDLVDILNRKYAVPKKGSKSEDEEEGIEDGGSPDDQSGSLSDITPAKPE